MRISNVSRSNFRGYDATSIKNLYMGMLQDNSDRDIFNDLKNITSREGIGLYCLTGGKIFDTPPEKWTGKGWGIWNQDLLYFTQENGQTKVHPSEDYKLPKNLAKAFRQRGIEEGKNYWDIDGGNFFLGKKENGDPYILVGENSEFQAKHIAKAKGIKEENFFVAPQGAFHIDMIMRPIGFPYILVNDIDIALKNAEKLQASKKEKERVKKEIKNCMFFLNKNGKEISGKEIAKKLEEQGFKPILVGGNYYLDVNFMNAIVHKRNDGSLVYITNSAENLGKTREQFQKIFEAELREKVPNLAKVDFILGENARKENKNTIRSFLDLDGGIHCLCTEEPDFDKWV